MRKLMSLLAAAVLAASASICVAQPAPMPDPVFGGGQGTPIIVQGGPVIHGGTVIESAETTELYHAVKYVDRREMAPCAKPMVVQIIDPCWKADPCNKCCTPPCVNVLICVPEHCCPPKIKTTNHGRNVRYDFGKYAVDVRAKKGYVEVDYQS